jgi:DNA-binding protein HU-beta
MNKTDLAQTIASKLDISKTSAHTLVDTVFETIADAIVRGERVLISDFGTFTVSHRRGFRGKNPKTGEGMDIAATQVPTFKTGRGLKARLNP